MYILISFDLSLQNMYYIYLFGNQNRLQHLPPADALLKFLDLR